jgi:hypothetical protein
VLSLVLAGCGSPEVVQLPVCAQPEVAESAGITAARDGGRRASTAVRPRRPGEVHPMTGRVARCDYCGNWFPVAAAVGYRRCLPAPAREGALMAENLDAERVSAGPSPRPQRVGAPRHCPSCRHRLPDRRAEGAPPDPQRRVRAAADGRLARARGPGPGQEGAARAVLAITVERQPRRSGTVFASPSLICAILLRQTY